VLSNCCPAWNGDAGRRFAPPIFLGGGFRGPCLKDGYACMTKSVMRMTANPEIANGRSLRMIKIDQPRSRTKQRKNAEPKKRLPRPAIPARRHVSVMTSREINPVLCTVVIAGSCGRLTRNRHRIGRNISRHDWNINLAKLLVDNFMEKMEKGVLILEKQGVKASGKVHPEPQTQAACLAISVAASAVARELWRDRPFNRGMQRTWEGL
jgi:hypothetical protein